MVQGANPMSIAEQQMSNDWSKSKKPILEATLRYEQEKQKAEKKKMDSNSKYGAWGSTFKNKNHFASLHHC
ncbi:unnamed protein product [Ceutorhynchus assimilis]|uniref:Uncharacterized protein n=1 Tax=Ceutorhynchus assimilis TaxID=467358 RepID=A0A9N9MKW3_9CUCU|nr:unnamed protein product [Ceutorhynchus assimilis]